MPLQKQSIAVRFAGGVETKADEKGIPATKLLALENAVFRKAISLVKRYGYNAISSQIDGSATALTGGVKLAKRDAELIYFTGDNAYSYETDPMLWADIGPVMSIHATDHPVVKTGTMQTTPDHATNGGITVYAWEDSLGGVYWTCVDATSKRVLRAPTQAHASAQSPRCVAVGAVLHIYYAIPTLQQIHVIVVNPSTPSASVTGSLLTDDLNQSTPVYDACPFANGTTDPAFIAWRRQAADEVTVAFVDASGVLGSSLTGHPPAASHTSDALHVAVAAAPERGASGAVSVLVSDGSGLVRAEMNANDLSTIQSSATVYSGTTINRIACTYLSALSGTLYYVAEEDAAAASNAYCIMGTGGANVTLRSVGLASRAFADDGIPMAVFVHDTTYFNTYVTVRLDEKRVVGRHIPGTATGLAPRSHLPSVHVDEDDARIWRIALPYHERLETDEDDGLDDQFTETGIRLVALDFAHDDSHQTAQLGRSLYMAGACPMQYDGRRWVEAGFHVGPEVIATAQGTSGSLTTTGTYLYVAWYEWTDAQGEIHRGPTSFGTSVTLTGSNDSVTLTLPTLRITDKENVRICVARGASTVEDPLFRVTSMDPTTAGDPNGYVANDTTVDTVSFEDRLSDVDVKKGEPLYINGGILSNDPPPLGNLIATGKSRLFFSDASDPLVVRFSQELDLGYGVECPPDLIVRVAPDGGDITALGVLDDKVVIFKRSAVYVFAGDGPLADGSTSDGGFSRPERIPGEVGCSDPSSIVATPVGLMFKSEQGIWILDRALGLSYVGAPVEQYNDQRIVRASLMEDRPQVVFLTDSGKTLLYDYLFGQWSTFTNHEGLDAAVVGGSYHYLRANGDVWQEAIDSYSDAGSAISMALETAWIHLQEQLQGFQRIYHLHLLGERRSAHTLQISHQTDYQVGWKAPVTVDADESGGTVYGEGDYGDGVYGGTPPAVYQWRVHLGEKCESIRFRFEDVESTGDAGASYELTEMLLTGGVKGPAYKPFASDRSA